MWEQGMIVLFIAVNQGKARQNLPLVVITTIRVQLSNTAVLYIQWGYTHITIIIMLFIFYIVISDLEPYYVPYSIPFHSVYAFSY